MAVCSILECRYVTSFYLGSFPRCHCSFIHGKALQTGLCGGVALQGSQKGLLVQSSTECSMCPFLGCCYHPKLPPLSPLRIKACPAFVEGFFYICWGIHRSKNFFNMLVEFLATHICCAFACTWLLDSLQRIKYFLKNLIFI